MRSSRRAAPRTLVLLGVRRNDAGYTTVGILRCRGDAFGAASRGGSMGQPEDGGLAILLEMAFQLSAFLLRALGLIWEPVFCNVRWKPARFLICCDFALENCEVQRCRFSSNKCIFL